MPLSRLGFLGETLRSLDGRIERAGGSSNAVCRRSPARPGPRPTRRISLVVNALSVDVEDYFHAEALTAAAPRDSWDSFESRVDRNTRRVLDLFSRTRVRGTFFVLGWVAERHPKLVRDIRAAGHEVACHSYWHRLIYRLTPEEFREDARKAKDIIEQ